MRKLTTAYECFSGDPGMRVSVEVGLLNLRWNSWAGELDQRFVDLAGDIDQLKQEITS